MAKRKAAARSKEPTFEEAMTRLEEIVQELEEAELPLEQSLKVLKVLNFLYSNQDIISSQGISFIMKTS